MSPTFNIDRNPNVTVTEAVLDPRPPDRIAFEAEGLIEPSEALLSEFEGASLKPVRVDLEVDRSRTVTIDLAEEGSLRLESLDVGVATPDADDVRRGLDTVRPSGDDGDPSADRATGTVAFTVEGAIRDLPEETVRSVVGESPTLASVTFSVAESIRTDGGSPVDVLLEVGLFGYGVVVRRDGTVEVTTGGAASTLDLR